METVTIRPNQFKVSYKNRTIDFSVSGERVTIHSLKGCGFIFQDSKPEMAKDIGTMLIAIGKFVEDKDIQEVEVNV